MSSNCHQSQNVHMLMLPHIELLNMFHIIKDVQLARSYTMPCCRNFQTRSIWLYKSKIKLWFFFNSEKGVKVKDSRPISLINGVNKLLFKIFFFMRKIIRLQSKRSNGQLKKKTAHAKGRQDKRLKPLQSHDQHAFIGGRKEDDWRKEAGLLKLILIASERMRKEEDRRKYVVFLKLITMKPMTW